jgi:hypothetical protein
MKRRHSRDGVLVVDAGAYVGRAGRGGLPCLARWHGEISAQSWYYILRRCLRESGGPAFLQGHKWAPEKSGVER